MEPTPASQGRLPTALLAIVIPGVEFFGDIVLNMQFTS